MAMITSTASGDFSAGATWVGGVAPADTDGFTVAAGHTVTFDMDQSAWAGLAASTIEATGILICDTAAGDYVLKMNGDLTLAGTLQAGTSVAVPLPATVTFTVNFSAGSHSIVIDDTTGSLLLYCIEPTIKFVTMTAQEPAAETVMAVDTNVSADTWAVGDTIAIIDLIPVGTSTRDGEEHTINAIASGTITLDAGLTNQKEIGAKIILITRNIRLINSTDYAVKEGQDGTNEIYCEIYNCTHGYYKPANATIGGSILEPSGVSSVGVSDPYNLTFDAAIAQIGSSGTSYGCGGSLVTYLSGSIIAGVYYGTVNIASVCDVVIAGCFYGHNQANSCFMKGDVIGCRYPFRLCIACFITSDIANADRIVYGGGANRFANCELGKSIGGVTSNNVLYEVNDLIAFYNCLFSATNEFLGYANDRKRLKSSYIYSEDHNQVANAYKAWCLGGIVTSDTSAPLPTGHTIKYIFTAEDTTQTYPVYRQFETTVQPGTAIEVEGYIAIPNGEDLTGYAPALQIIDKFADPLVDATQEPLDECEIPDPDGSETGYQAVSVIWANQGDAPRTVIVRMIVWHDGGGNDVVIYGAWSIADYKDKINDILADTNEIQGKLPDDYIMGSSTTESMDDEINAIKANLGQVHQVEDETPGGRRPIRTSGIAEGC